MDLEKVILSHKYVYVAGCQLWLPYRNVFDAHDFCLDTIYSNSFHFETMSAIFHRKRFKWGRLQEAKNLLDLSYYRAAMLLALTSIDICSRFMDADYNDSQLIMLRKHNKNAYIHWYDKYVGAYRVGGYGGNCGRFDCITGFLCYEIRCAMVHRGDYSLNDFINKEESALSHEYHRAVLKWSSDRCFSVKTIFFGQQNGVLKKVVCFDISLYHFLMEILSVCESFYEEHIDHPEYFSDGIFGV